MDSRRNLEDLSEAFAQTLSDTINGVLDGRHELALREAESRWILEPSRTGDGVKIPWLHLTLPGSNQRIGRLQFRYELSLDHRDEFLKVVFSSCTIRAEADGTALLRLDYQPENMRGERAPVAHWQVHGHHNAFASWLTLAKGTRRRTGNESGRLDKVHLTVGGERFRPCMEDVLQLLITDFGVAKKPGAMAAIRKGRAEWRDLQLRTAVRDNPAVAAEALEQCGFRVEPVEPKTPRLEKLRHY